MAKITYVEGDIFELADKRSVLAHACNCEGVWESGIAKEFKSRFIIARDTYFTECKKHKYELMGKTVYIPEIWNDVACLMTSRGFGLKVDKREQIIEATKLAVADLLSNPIFNNRLGPRVVHMPKINSGLFRVPWEETEKVLLSFVDDPVEFIVYVL